MFLARSQIAAMAAKEPACRGATSNQQPVTRNSALLIEYVTIFAGINDSL
ncbi:MAG: hypothetical protein WAL29_10580 [Bacteroidales bacterium]